MSKHKPKLIKSGGKMHPNIRVIKVFVYLTLLGITLAFAIINQKQELVNIVTPLPRENTFDN